MAVSATDTNNTALLASLNASSAGSSAGDIKEVSDRFLKLLVTQLKNQDPLNPMENAELTTQMAQMSTVEGINNLNANFTALMDSYKSSQTLQAASLLGHQVLSEGDQLQLNNGLAGGAFNLASTSENTHVLVKNSVGALIADLNLGKQSAGTVRFAWDGTNAQGQNLPDGRYKFEVQALSGNQTVTATPYSLGEVLSVSLDSSDMSIETSTQGKITLSQIKQIF